jgi:hypothetical protein
MTTVTLVRGCGYAHPEPARTSATRCRPVLPNIYLHRLDEFVQSVLIPEYTEGVFGSSDGARRELSRGSASTVRASW